MVLDVQRLRTILPHRYPFLLIDRVTDFVKDESLNAYKNITINEELFNGHFPQMPIFPGVYIIEGMAQAGGVLAFLSMFGEDCVNDGSKSVLFMSVDKAKFRGAVVPGDKLEYRIKKLKQKRNIWLVKGEAFVDDKLVAEAELMAMITSENKN